MKRKGPLRILMERLRVGDGFSYLEVLGTDSPFGSGYEVHSLASKLKIRVCSRVHPADSAHERPRSYPLHNGLVCLRLVERIS